MKNLSVTTVGGACAVLMTLCFAAAIPLLVSSGVQVLIPETGHATLDWIADVDEAGRSVFVGAWLIVAAGLFGAVAIVGFYDALRSAGPLLVLAPILGLVGVTLITISHLIPIAMAYELVPGYVDADAASRSSLTATAETLASVSLVVNYTGNILNWGVVAPLYAVAILTTSIVPRWIGWVGIVVAVFAGWLGLLAPASSVIEGLTNIGFIADFVFTASLGVALLRRRPRAEELVSASAH